MRFHLGIRTWVFGVFVLLMVIGMGAVVGFFRIQGAVTAYFEQDRHAALTGQRMLHRLASVQHGLMEALLSSPADDVVRRVDVDTVRQEVRTWMQGLQTVSPAGRSDEELLRVEKSWEAFLNAVREFQERRASQADAAALWRSHVALVVPPVTHLQRELQEWMQVSERRMELSRTRAVQWAWNSLVAMVAATFVGMLALLLFNYQMRKAIIQPAALISRMLDRVNGGETHLRLPAMQEEHLNRIVLACNRMFESVEVLAEESQKKIASERAIVSALIESFPMPALVLDLAGEMLLANAAARDIFTETEGAVRYAVLRECLAMESSLVSFEGKQYHTERRVAPDANRRGAVSLVLLHRVNSGKSPSRP